jgi:hypothetical protein
MSWNIQKFGLSTLAKNHSVLGYGSSKLLKFVASVIDSYNVDIVGIMEIVGGAGDILAIWLEVELNNCRPANPTYEWHAIASARQKGGTHEEYLFLWKQEAGRIQPYTENPFPTISINHQSFFLYGVLNDWNFDFIFEANLPQPYTAAQKVQFWDALESNGYRSDNFRVPINKWHSLQQAQAKAQTNVAMSKAPSSLNGQQLKNIQQILLHTKPVCFPKPGNRSPFISDFMIGVTKRLRIALLHAPNPSDPDKYDAINNLALINDLQDTNVNRLLMGDFNTDDGDTRTGWRMDFAQDPNNTAQYSFTYLVPRQHDPVFTRVTGAPLNMAKQMNNQNTTLTSICLGTNATHGDTLTTSNYDNFYFGSKAANPDQITVSKTPNSHPQVVDLISQINGGTLGIDALSVFLDRQGNLQIQKWIDSFEEKLKTKKVKNSINLTTSISNQIQALKDHQIFLKSSLNTVPKDFGLSHLVYVSSISDHLPILITLDY